MLDIFQLRFSPSARSPRLNEEDRVRDQKTLVSQRRSCSDNNRSCLPKPEKQQLCKSRLSQQLRDKQHSLLLLLPGPKIIRSELIFYFYTQIYIINIQQNLNTEFQHILTSMHRKPRKLNVGAETATSMSTIQHACLLVKL